MRLFHIIKSFYLYVAYFDDIVHLLWLDILDHLLIDEVIELPDFEFFTKIIFQVKKINDIILFKIYKTNICFYKCIFFLKKK